MSLSVSPLPLQAGATPSRSFHNWLVRETRAHPLIYSSIAVFVAYSFADAAMNGEPVVPILTTYVLRIFRSLIVLCSAIVAIVAIRALMIRNDKSPLGNVLEPIGGLLKSGLLLRYLYASLVLAVFMAAFLYHKMNIPRINGFRWDATFAEWDLILFGGRHPWEILFPYLSSTFVTSIIDIVYSSWVPVVFLFWAGLLISPRVPETIRVRYWTATIVSWLLIGIVMATFLSSAGPVYFAEVVPGVPSPYAGLNAFLAQTAKSFPMSSSMVKDLLWASHLGRTDLPGGISAMPSMHNAQAALFVAAAYSVNRRFGHATLAYAILIFVGSIHLAWHYAVDGLVGIAAALIVWFAVGAIAKRFWSSRRVEA